MTKTQIEIDEDTCAEIDGHSIFLKRLAKIGWKTVISISASEMDKLCGAWERYKQKPPVGARGTSTGGDPAESKQSGVEI